MDSEQNAVIICTLAGVGVGDLFPSLQRRLGDCCLNYWHVNAAWDGGSFGAGPVSLREYVDTLVSNLDLKCIAFVPGHPSVRQELVRRSVRLDLVYPVICTEQEFDERKRRDPLSFGPELTWRQWADTARMSSMEQGYRRRPLGSGQLLDTDMVTLIAADASFWGSRTSSVSSTVSLGFRHTASHSNEPFHR